MIKMKNAILACYLLSLLHGGNCAPTSLIPTIAIRQALHAQSTALVKGDYNNCYPAQMREISFINDLSDLCLLNQNLIPYTQELKNIKVIIRAVSEHLCGPNQQIDVTIENNELVIVINEMSADLLYECAPIKKLLPEKIKAPNLLEKYCNKAHRWAIKLGLYVLGKTIAKFAKCTIIIHSNVDPNEDADIRCAEVIVDLHDLDTEKQLDIKRQWRNLLNMDIIIKEKEQKA